MTPVISSSLMALYSVVTQQEPVSAIAGFQAVPRLCRCRGKKVEVKVMIKDDRDTLQVLKAELEFIEKGGYGRSVRTPWKPTSIFQDSLSCLNMGDPERTHPCDECLLIDFVPPERRAEDVPCHHIPLSMEETVETLKSKEDREQLEQSVTNWIRARIKQIEQEQAAPNAV